MRAFTFLLVLPLAVATQNQNTTTVMGKNVVITTVSSPIMADTEENLVLSAAPLLKNYSQITGHEACAQICKSSDQFASNPLKLFRVHWVYLL